MWYRFVGDWQALLSTRRALRTRKNRRNANVAERASHASPFPVGGRVVGGLVMEIEERCEGKDMEDATFD